MDNAHISALDSDECEQYAQVETPRRVVVSSGDATIVLTANEMVRYIQKYAGFNNKELGNIFGVSRRSIQNWASGSAISESNTAKINLFYVKMMSLTDLTPKESRAVLTSRDEGESFIQVFKRMTKRAQTMLVPIPIEARFA